MPFNTFEDKTFTQLLEMAISEDIDSSGDLTSKATLPSDLKGKANAGAATPAFAVTEKDNGYCSSLTR